MEQMDGYVDEMEVQMDLFEKNVEKWKEEQQAKAVLGVFTAIFTIGLGMAEAIVDPEAIFGAVATAAEGLQDIAEIMENLVEVAETINEIELALKDLEGEDLEDISITLSIDYKDCLQNSIQMKQMAATFDDIEFMARNTLEDLQQATDDGIEGTADLQRACTNVANCGRRQTDTVSDFADKMMQLAERQDELIVAQDDLTRATEQVIAINFATNYFLCA